MSDDVRGRALVWCIIGILTAVCLGAYLVGWANCEDKGGVYVRGECLQRMP